VRILQNDQFVPQSTPPRLDHGEVHAWFFAHWPNARDSARSLTVREYLARYLDVDAAAVQIDLESNGKPRLRGGGFHFNVSHSGDAMLLAVSRDHDIGVDLEFSRRPRRVVELAQRWFDPIEADALQALPESARQIAFLRLWTCKEAALKADGGGISSGLRRVSFKVNDAGEIDEAVDPAWRLVRLEPAPGYVGAVAWKGPDQPVRTFIAAAR
jgi:4'-phosphopantetheinyl transferase